jgi:hypothetical protein
MIDITKKYRTRDGREVRIYATDGRGIYPVHGAVKVEGGWLPYTWKATGVEGVNNVNDVNDLIEVRPRHKRTVWLNVYKDCPSVVGWNSKEAADGPAHTRTACIKVELDFEEGEGLSP